MTNSSNRHPADGLALALDRTSGLLSAVSDLYDPSAERFTGGEAFVAHALSTVGELVSSAKLALTELHYACDLTIVETAVTADPEPVEEVSSQSDSDDLEEIHESVFADEEHEAAVLRTEPVRSEEFAQSYLELLSKLTAAEVFAAEQQALSVPGSTSELLPLLKSLREDLQKIHSAA